MASSPGPGNMKTRQTKYSIMPSFVVRWRVKSCIPESEVPVHQHFMTGRQAEAWVSPVQACSGSSGHGAAQPKRGMLPSYLAREPIDKERRSPDLKAVQIQTVQAEQVPHEA